MKPELKSTTDYDLFEMHEMNRNLHENKVLENSMRTNGFMPSGAIHCASGGRGKLKVIRGHHRLYFAKRIGLPVWYIVDETKTDLFALEGSSTVSWGAADFAIARAKAGDKDIQEMLDFKAAHDLPLGSASSLMFGQSAGSSNAVKCIKTGAFRCKDTAHAKKVVKITDMLKDSGVTFATSSNFVAALSSVLRVPEVDYNKLLHRASLHGHVLSKRSTRKEYLEEIQAMYNYTSRGDRVPIAFLAEEVLKSRSVCPPKK